VKGKSEMKSKEDSQRLFQKGAHNFVLLNTEGQVVAFPMEDKIKIINRQSDVDFKSTGNALRADGWQCIGPGLEYSWLFEP
jgi:hypothetical protein